MLNWNQLSTLQRSLGLLVVLLLGAGAFAGAADAVTSGESAALAALQALAMLALGAAVLLHPASFGPLRLQALLAARHPLACRALLGLALAALLMRAPLRLLLG